MNLKKLYAEIKSFSKGTHGSSDLYKDEIFVLGEDEKSFAPLKHLSKKIEGFTSVDQLQKAGFVSDAYDLYEFPGFKKWFESQFSRKLTRTIAKKISLYHIPNNKEIFDAIETVHKCYEVLRTEHILLNGKNLPVQLGEWYAKAIFGLSQIKSSSQRGFDFYIGKKRTEIKVHWSDHSSPKGVKVRKSLVDLSQYCIVIYLARNFMIREICFLDSSFVLRKFGGKGHTIFLKDPEVSQYFFSQSDKHVNKVKNSSALLKYSNPTFAMKIAEGFQEEEK